MVPLFSLKSWALPKAFAIFSSLYFFQHLASHSICGLSDTDLQTIWIHLWPHLQNSRISASQSIFGQSLPGWHNAWHLWEHSTLSFEHLCPQPSSKRFSRETIHLPGTWQTFWQVWPHSSCVLQFCPQLNEPALHITSLFNSLPQLHRAWIGTRQGGQLP